MKIGPFWNSNDAPAVGVLDDHVRAENVGRHQVGRELDAVEVQVQRLGQRPHEQRLAQARHAFQQAVPADEHARQHAVHDVVVPDDHAPDLLLDRRDTDCRNCSACCCIDSPRLMDAPLDVGAMG